MCAGRSDEARIILNTLKVPAAKIFRISSLLPCQSVGYPDPAPPSTPPSHQLVEQLELSFFLLHSPNNDPCAFPHRYDDWLIWLVRGFQGCSFSPSHRFSNKKLCCSWAQDDVPISPAIISGNSLFWLASLLPSRSTYCICYRIVSSP
jgi:hypothetical protein